MKKLVVYLKKQSVRCESGLSEVEGALNEIRSSGKQDYLNKDHPNFTSIMHDYSAAQKGFTAWKGFLEQRLV